jgi:hypothetical protein
VSGIVLKMGRRKRRFKRELIVLQLEFAHVSRLEVALTRLESFPYVAMYEVPGLRLGTGPVSQKLGTPTEGENPSLRVVPSSEPSLPGMKQLLEEISHIELRIIEEFSF